VEKVVIVFSHMTTNRVEEKVCFEFKEWLSKTGEINFAAVRKELSIALLQIICSESRVEAVPDSCTFSVEVHTVETNVKQARDIASDIHWRDATAELKGQKEGDGRNPPIEHHMRTSLMDCFKMNIVSNRFQYSSGGEDMVDDW
jgi:hypothetical protein